MDKGPDEHVFDPGGGITPPNHLRPDDLTYIGHLLGNPMTSVRVLMEFNDDEAINELNELQTRLLEVTSHLLESFTEDLASIPGLTEFLVEFRRVVEKKDWNEAARIYLAGKETFGFVFGKKKPETNPPLADR